VLQIKKFHNYEVVQQVETVISHTGSDL